MDIRIAKKVFIRNQRIGDKVLDEKWLQAEITAKPSILGLGELTQLRKESTQPTGGRLDFLFADTENVMYEVEVMLGATDPSHIIRCIEYWDVEKRRYPKRQHFAVLAAESFDRRYFNVIQILSLNVPMIAVQIDLLEVDGGLVLHGRPILNVYVEPQDSESEIEGATKEWWNKTAKWTLETALSFSDLIQVKNKYLNFTKSYISIVVENKMFCRFDRRTEPSSILILNIPDDEKVDEIKKVLDDAKVRYQFNVRYHDFVLPVDAKDEVAGRRDALQAIIDTKLKRNASFEE